MTKSPNDDFEFEFVSGDGPHTYSQAVETVLRRVEEQINTDGWDLPFRMMVIQMGELAGMTSFGVLEPKNFPDINADVSTLLPKFVVSLVAEESMHQMLDKRETERDHQQVTRLDRVIQPGFIGWVSVSEVWYADHADAGAVEFWSRGELDQYPGRKEQRMVTFVDVYGGIFLLSRTRGSEPVFENVGRGNNRESRVAVGVMPNCHLALNMASLMSLFRRHPDAEIP